MTISVAALAKGTAWTIGAYGVGQGLRFVTNIVLARLLAPELFGIMLIVNSLKTGIAHFADCGTGKSIIYHKDANRPDFYNTAWTLEIIRCTVLCLVCLATAVSVADFYQAPILAWVLPISAITFLLTGLSSTSRYLLQKRMELAKLNIFETVVAFASSAAHVLFAFLSPTVWALVLGGILDSAMTMVGSHFLLSDVKNRLFISKQYTREILSFGKWIFVASIVWFLSMHYDRLYLPKVIPLDLIGVYGIARSISELVVGLALRLGNAVLFPLVASHSQTSRAELHRQLAPIRGMFLGVTALGVSILVATIDVAATALYDERYQAISWMLPVLMMGSWFSILATSNDMTVLGLGKPAYSAMCNAARLAFLVIGLPLGFAINGIVGVVLIIALADLSRYFPALVGLRREGFSFGVQDVVLTLAVFAFVGVFESLRWTMGFGTSFDTLPVRLSALVNGG